MKTLSSFAHYGRFLLLLSLPMLLFVNCEDNIMGYPDPSIQTRFNVIVGNNGMAPAECVFINTSLNANNFIWDFGDGTTLQTDADTVYHTYETAGNFKARLTADIPGHDLHYSNLSFERIIQIREDLVKRLYFTCRVDDKVKYIVLDDSEDPVVHEFDHAGYSRPYGLAVDTVNGKVYATDYGTDQVFRYNYDGTGMEMIMSGPPLRGPLGITVYDNHIYIGNEWSVIRADLDGSNPEVYLQLSASEAPQEIIDLVFDQVNEQVFLTNDKWAYTGGVFRMNIDGSNLIEIVSGTDGGGIVVDPENDRLIYYDWEQGMCLNNLDGTNEVVFDTSNQGAQAWGIAIDLDAGKVYYGDRNSGTIKRANLDGSGVEVVVPASAAINPNAMAIDTFR